MRDIDLNLELSTGALVANTFENITRRDRYRIRLWLRRNGVPVVMPFGSVFAGVAKASASGDTVLHLTDWTASTRLSEPYTALLPVYGEALDEAFQEDALEQLPLNFEISIIPPGEEGAGESSAKLPLVILNDYVRSADLALPDPADPENPWVETDQRYYTKDEMDQVIQDGVFQGPPGAQGPTGATGATGATGPAGFATTKIIAATSYTLLLSDVGKVLIFIAATQVTVTVPDQATTVWAADAQVCLSRGGAGHLRAVGEDETLLNGEAVMGAFDQVGAAMVLFRTAENDWHVMGGNSEI